MSLLFCYYQVYRLNLFFTAINAWIDSWSITRFYQSAAYLPFKPGSVSDGWFFFLVFFSQSSLCDKGHIQVNFSTRIILNSKLVVVHCDFIVRYRYYFVSSGEFYSLLQKMHIAFKLIMHFLSLTENKNGEWSRKKIFPFATHHSKRLIICLRES
jgi:hypothetical protein